MLIRTCCWHASLIPLISSSIVVNIEFLLVKSGLVLFGPCEFPVYNRHGMFWRERESVSKQKWVQLWLIMKFWIMIQHEKHKNRNINLKWSLFACFNTSHTHTRPAPLPEVLFLLSTLSGSSSGWLRKSWMRFRDTLACATSRPKITDKTVSHEADRSYSVGVQHIRTMISFQE